MGFKELTDLSTDNVTAIGGVDKKTGKKNPSSIEGYLIGTRQVDSKKAKSGKANIYVLQTPKGKQGVWGKTNLDQKMGSVRPGTMIRISHTGMQNTPNGPMYVYKVEVDTDNTIEVDGIDATDREEYTSAASDSDDDNTYAQDNTEEYSSDDADAEEAEQQAALEAAERAAKAAKVQALLKKKGAPATKN